MNNTHEEDKHLKLHQLIAKYYDPKYTTVDRYPIKDCAAFNKTDDEWGVFSNFAPTPLTVVGVTFVNSEQLFQMMKFNDPEALKDIYNARGMTIKMKNKHWSKLGYVREDWGRMVVDAMKYCLQAKYEQSNAFRRVLEASKGKCIVEDETTRCKGTRAADTWGVKADGEYFVGSNLMGKLLMELREGGKIAYTLPDDALQFVETVREIIS